MMDTIQISHLTKSYKKTLALNDVNLELKPGVCGLLGPNGAGKTTFIRILATLMRSDSGEITMGNISWKLPNDVRADLGYLPQSFGMYNYMSLYKSLEHIAILKGLEKEKLKSEIERVLKLTNLTEHSQKAIKQLSGGMVRRLGIAQALLGDPRILLFDEPTAGLDPSERIRFRNIISSVSQDKIILISTHIVSDVETSCDRVAVINKGKLLAYDSVSAIAQKAIGRVAEIEILSDELEEKQRKLNVISISDEENGKIKLRYLCDNSDAQIIPTLEDGYMCLTSDSD